MNDATLRLTRFATFRSDGTGTGACSAPLLNRAYPHEERHSSERCLDWHTGLIGISRIDLGAGMNRTLGVERDDVYERFKLWILVKEIDQVRLIACHRWWCCGGIAVSVLTIFNRRRKLKARCGGEWLGKATYLLAHLKNSFEG